MRPTQAIPALGALVDARQAAFVWGPPGIGKSDVIAQLAEQRGIELRDVRMNLMDPTDIKGFPAPDIKKGEMRWLPPDFLPRDPKSEGILFLDELNQAAPATQAAAYQLVLNRCVGDYKLPDGWSIVAAGNRQTDRANAQRMPSALANRFVHLQFETHLDDWCSWAIDKEVPTDLISFLRFKPDLLAPEGAFADGQHAFPTPRSWSFVGKMMNSNLPADVELELFKGTVGEGPAGELVSFLQICRELPSIDQVKMDPDGTPVSTNPAINFAMAGALAAVATANAMPRFMKYVQRLPVEFQVCFIRDGVARSNKMSNAKEKIMASKEFRDWSVKNGDYLV